MISKKELAQYYFRKYEIKARASEIQNLTEKQLLIQLETRWQLEKENLAAIKLQSFGRMVIWRTFLLNFIKKRHESASKIQKTYRRYRLFTLIPKTWRSHKKKAALMV